MRTLCPLADPRGNWLHPHGPLFSIPCLFGEIWQKYKAGATSLGVGASYWSTARDVIDKDVRAYFNIVDHAEKVARYFQIVKSAADN